MKLTESKLRNIIREELSRLTEMGGGSEYAIYEIRPGELQRVKNGERPADFGIKMEEGSVPVLQNWAKQQGMRFKPDAGLPYGDGYFAKGRDSYYVIGKNKR